MAERIRIVVLPGLDGTGQLLGPLAAELDMEVVHFPTDEALGYSQLEERIEAALPKDGRFILVGESFSGPLVLRIAAKRPRGLVGVVMVGTFLSAPVPRVLRVFAPLLKALWFSWPLPSWLVRRLLAGRDAPESLIQEVRRVVRSVKPRVLAHRLREILMVDARAALTAVKVPILWISGGKDALLRPMDRAQLVAINAGVETSVVDAPHFILEREPLASAELIRAFIERHVRSK